MIWIVLTFLGIILLEFALGLFSHWHSALMKRMREPESDRLEGRSRDCRKCGFDLADWRHPQCPKCNSMIGFKKSMSELGFSPDECDAIKKSNLLDESSRE